jgi:hypothetical protein
MEACSAVGAEDAFSIKAHHFAVRAIITLASRVELHLLCDKTRVTLAVRQVSQAAACSPQWNMLRCWCLFTDTDTARSCAWQCLTAARSHTCGLFPAIIALQQGLPADTTAISAFVFGPASLHSPPAHSQYPSDGCGGYSPTDSSSYAVSCSSLGPSYGGSSRSGAAAASEAGQQQHQYGYAGGAGALSHRMSSGRRFSRQGSRMRQTSSELHGTQCSLNVGLYDDQAGRPAVQLHVTKAQQVC